MSTDDDHEAKPPIVPQPNDVLLGRSKVMLSWKGNQRFQAEIERNAVRYRDAQSSSRALRSSIITEIIETISTWARFLEKCEASGQWFIAEPSKVRIKVGQALRYQVELLQYPAPASAPLSGTVASQEPPDRVAAAAEPKAESPSSSADSETDKKPPSQGSVGRVDGNCSGSSSTSSLGITSAQLDAIDGEEQQQQRPLLSDSEILSSVGCQRIITRMDPNSDDKNGREQSVEHGQPASNAKRPPAEAPDADFDERGAKSQRREYA